jgi:hypothetical protein
VAVLDSFKKAGAAIVNHHTLVQNKTFNLFVASEPPNIRDLRNSFFTKFCLFYFFAWSKIGWIAPNCQQRHLKKLFRMRLKKINVFD